MKLKFVIAVFLLIGLAGNALADDAGLRIINTRGKVFCGTDVNSATYAYKDDYGVWRGIDADLCRAFAQAIIGRAENFEMKNVDAPDIGNALREGRIDFMLGSAPYSAGIELKKKYMPAAITYYDTLMFLAFDKGEAKSMEAFVGRRVCAVTGSEDLNSVQEYSNKYSLDLKVLFFADGKAAQEAFLTKRCELLAGNKTYLQGILNKSYAETSKIVLIPEDVAVKPVYVFVDAKNDTLRSIAKWIVNALVLAEAKEIDSKNVEIFSLDKNASVQNILGEDPKLWNGFGLRPDWVKKYVKDFGNYREVIMRNLDEPVRENNLIKDGGAVNFESFL